MEGTHGYEHPHLHLVAVSIFNIKIYVPGFIPMALMAALDTSSKLPHIKQK